MGGGLEGSKRKKYRKQDEENEQQAKFKEDTKQMMFVRHNMDVLLDGVDKSINKKKKEKESNDQKS